MNWKLRDGVSWARTDYGGVLLDSATGDYWRLNPTGATVLTSALAGFGTERTVAALADVFDVGEDALDLAEDVSAVLAELAAARLVVRP